MWAARMWSWRVLGPRLRPTVVISGLACYTPKVRVELGGVLEGCQGMVWMLLASPSQSTTLMGSDRPLTIFINLAL